MNRALLSTQDLGGLPEHVEAELKPSSKATCVTSNRWGTMLAVGCEDGTTVVYDMITRGEACTFPPSSAEDVAEVSAVAFYRYGSSLVSGHANGVVVSRDICQNVETASRRYSQAISRLSLSERPEPTLCVSLASGSPHVIAPDGSSKPLQVPCTGQVSAIIERSEQYILVAAHSGSILIVDPKGFGVLDAIQDAPFRSLAFNSKSSSFVVVGGNSIRHWCVQPVLPEHRHDTQPVHTTLQRLASPDSKQVPQAGAIISRACTECKDHVEAFKWCCADVSRDGEYICAGAVAPDKHIIYIWQASGGHVASVLEGPDGGLQWCGWQPDPGRLILLSRTDRGTVMVWAHLLSQQWDVYAPGFRSLQQNEEYVESETEFDLNPKGDEEPAPAQQQLDLTCKMEFTGVRDDEQFLFESDTEEDFRRAVLCPPLDLKGMAQDGKGPVEKPAPKLAAQPAAQPAAAAEKAKGEPGEPTAQCEANPTTGGDSAPDVIKHPQDASATDLEQPAKRAKLESEND